MFLAAAAAGQTTLVAPLRSHDTEAFADGLRQLGYQVEQGEATWKITGKSQNLGTDGASVYCADGATTARFLPALAATRQGTVDFDASEQMRRRPMAPLTNALRQLGVDIDFRGKVDHHPFTLTTSGIEGGHLTLDAGTSSQFLTALLLLAPLTRQGLQIDVTDLVSVPYVEMTIAMMASFGVEVEVGGKSYRVAPQPYTARTYTVEPDASSASYFFAAAALLGETITVPHLGSGSLQGDLGFVDVLARMGATVSKNEQSTTVTGNGRLHGITVNMRDISDTMPTLAAIAPFADGPTRIVDVYNTRVKECDRLDACATNLRALGIRVETGRDWIEIWPGDPVPAQIACHGDHRIAMAFSVTGLRVPGITLDDPSCVKKTFPQFHQVLATLIDQLRDFS